VRALPSGVRKPVLAELGRPPAHAREAALASVHLKGNGVRQRALRASVVRSVRLDTL